MPPEAYISLLSDGSPVLIMAFGLWWFQGQLAASQEKQGKMVELFQTVIKEQATVLAEAKVQIQRSNEILERIERTLQRTD